MKIILAVAMLVAALMPGTTALLADEVAQTELARRTFLGGRVGMLVPRSFRILSPAEIRRAYLNRSPPDAAIIDKGHLFDIAIEHTAVPMEPGGLSEFLDRLREGLPKRRPKARIIRLAMIRRDGRSFALAFLEKPGPSRFGSGRVDSDTVGTILSGRLLLIAFNSDVSKRAVWAAARDRMIRSIRVQE
jgi:hypothetical protein